MAADLFETYAVTIVATMVLSSIFFVGDLNMMIYPLTIGAACILTGRGVFEFRRATGAWATGYMGGGSRWLRCV